MINKIRKTIVVFITLALLGSTLMPGIALAGSVINLSDSSINITEGDSPVYVDQNVTVTSSTSFDDGYVRFSVDGANTGDIFSVVSDANPNASGAISFSGSTVYLGDGSGTTAIGVIDSTENGQNGQPLKINFSSPMANSGFESGTTGWSINESEYRMSGDTLSSPTFDAYVASSGGNNYLHMYIRGYTSSYGTGHGPYAISSYFEASPGDTIAFDWKAADSGDDFDVYVYLINDNTGSNQQILYQRGDYISSWQTKEIYLSSSYLTSYSDKLKFVFICGSYDATGGTVVGSTLDIDNVRVVKQYATASVVDTIISQVKYQNTSDDPAATRTITVQTSDENGTTDSDTRNVNITPVNDAPAIGTNNGLTVNEDTTGTITSSKLNEADPDDSGTGCIYTVTSNVSNGALKKSGVTMGVGTTFTQSDIDNGYITYTHNGSETTSDSFGFSLADGGEDGTGTVSGTFSITVTPVNDAPTLDTNAALSVNEGTSGTIDETKLSASDVDNAVSALFYTVTSAPGNGDVKKSGSALSAGDTFTQTDIDNGIITYTHDGSETTSDTFGFRLSDGSATQDGTFSITVTPVNDAPVIGTNTGMTLSEDTSKTITSTMLNEADPDDSGAGCVYTLTICPDYGTLKVGADILGTGDTFTQADIDNGLLVYTHDGSETTSDLFMVDLADGGEDGAGTDMGAFSITVTAVNDAPTLDTNTGLSVDEGTGGSIDTSVLSASDPDNTDSELIYTITSAPGNGDVQCGSSIVGTGDTFTQADIAAGRVSYLHDGSDTTSDSFEFRLTDGAATQDGTFSITVTPVNDAPVIGTNAGLTLDEDTTATITSAMLNEDDPDDSGMGCVYTLTDNTDNGTLRLNGILLDVGDTFTQTDVDNDLLSYTHNGGETTSDAFTVALADGGEDGVSADTQTFNITVTPVNDAPIIVDQTFDVDENAPADTVVGTVAVYDAENNAMTYVITSGNTDAAFSIDEDDGTITVAGTIDHDTIQQYVLDVSITEADTAEHYGETIQVTIDVNNLHDVPPTPEAADLVTSSDSGVSDTDNITNDTTPSFDGAADGAMAGSTIKVYADSQLVATTTANEDGSWHVTSVSLTDGTYDITVTSTDNGGDVSGTSAALAITIDTAAPDADTAPYLASGGSTTDDRTPEIACSNEAYAYVTVYGDSGVLLGITRADENGNWSFTVADEDALSVGAHTFTYTLSDEAGNLSPSSPGLAIIVNDPPEGTDITVATDEDTIYVFSVADFGYSDLNDDEFEQIKILTLPENGSLQYYDDAWQNTEVRQVVSAADIAAGYLRFVPEADKNGIGYASFEHKVNDGIDYSKQSNMMTVDVTPVNDVHTLSGLTGDSYDYLEDQGAAVLDNGQDAAIADIDNYNYADGALIALVTAGGTPREDVIGIDTEDGILILSDGMNAGSEISIGGVLIGTVDAASGTSGKLIVNLGAGSTLDNVAALMQHITYENSNHTNPSTLMRTITLTVEDKDGLYADASVTVSITRTEKASVTTTANGGITVSSIVLGGEVTSNGRAKVTECGVVYSTQAGFDPASEGTRIEGAFTSGGMFRATATGLEQNTTYYYAAYAVNSEGTSYGSVRSATTYRNSDKNGDGELDDPDADSDGDGISDGDEIAAGSDPDEAASTPSDTDGDGQVDNASADTDGDGVSDGDEIAAGSDPDDASSTPSDIDGDGQVDDPDADSDGDGISDGDEIAAGSDPDDASSMPEGQMSVLQPTPAQIPPVPTRNTGMNVWQSTSGTTDTAIALGWDSVPSADYYLIWDISAEPVTVVGMVDGSGTSCLISGLMPGTDYEYKVGAYSAGGDGMGSNDELLGADTIKASTHGTGSLPLDAIMNEVTGGVPSTPDGNRIDLTGQVTDENGMPLAGLTVELHSNPRTTVTDSSGWYFFDSVEEGEHTVYVYYGDTVTEMQLDLQIERDENAEGVQAVNEDGCVKFTVNEPAATLVLSMSMNEDGTLSIQHVEAQPVVYVKDSGLPLGSGGVFGTLWWIIGGLIIVAAGVFIIFFFIKRKREDEEETA